MTIIRKAFMPGEFKLEESGAVTIAFAQLNVVDHDKDVSLPGSFPTKTVPISAYGHTSWSGAMPVGKGTIREDFHPAEIYPEHLPINVSLGYMTFLFHLKPP